MFRTFLLAWMCLPFWAFAATKGPIALNMMGKDLSLSAEARTNLMRLAQTPVDWTHRDHLKKTLITQIKKITAPEGYFSPELRLFPSKEAEALPAELSLGPPTHIKALALTLSGEGAEEPQLTAFFQQLQKKQGSVFLSAEYEKDKQTLFEITDQLGYLDARLVRSEVSIDIKQHTATLHWTLQTGPRYHIGAVTVKQTPSVFSDLFLSHLIDIHSGTVFSKADLLKVEQTLINSRYFKFVDLHFEKADSTTHTVPITVEAYPYPSQKYLLGLGYESDTGVRATTSFTLNHLGKTAQTLSTVVQASHKEHSFQMRYQIPSLTRPLTEQYFFDAGLENIEYPQNRAQIQHIAAGQIKDRGSLQTTCALTLQEDRYTLNPLPKMTTQTFYPSLHFLYLDTEHPILTQQGLKVSLSLKGGLKDYGSQLSFTQYQLHGKYITPVREGTRLVMKGHAGYVDLHHQDMQKLPLSFRFYGGGVNSIRGYAYQALGPGTRLLTLSTELQQRIKGSWYGGLFYDMGDAYIQRMHLHKKLGLASIWLSPVGPIEISFTRDRQAPAGSHALQHFFRRLRIQFTMGPDL